MNVESDSRIFVSPLNLYQTMQKTDSEDLSKNENPSSKKRLGLLGIAGLVFFTVKGLLWLIIPLLIAKGCIAD